MATILVVDDEKPVREFIAMSLEQAGHHVLLAYHGRHALSLIRNAPTPPDLVVSDVMMPLVGGVELCRLLKADAQTARIPIILMSAAHARSTATADADAFLAKPFDLDVLDALVDQLLAARA